MVYIAQQSFGFGEIDPNIRAQYESQPYQRGCQRLLNAYLSDTGSAIKRWGSVSYTAGAGTQEAYEFYDGYNTRFILVDIPINAGLSGETRGYRILKDGDTADVAVAPSWTAKHTVSLADKYVKHVATSGNELFVLTLDGLYKHSILKDTAGTYRFERSHAEISADLLASTPPVTFTCNNATTPTEVTTSGPWFTEEDHGDLYKLCEKADPLNNSTSPRWGIIANVIDAKTATVATVDSIHLDASSTAFTNGQLKITNHGFVSSTATNPVAVKWYRGNVASTYYNPGPVDDTTYYVEVIDDNTIALNTNVSLNPSNAVNIESTFGQDPSTYLLKLGDSTGLPNFDDAVTTPSFEWVGPYRNWELWGRGIYTNYNYTGAGQTKPTQVYADATQWSAWAQGETLKWDNDGWGTATDNLEQKMGMVGAVAKAVHYKQGKVHKTSYFHVNWHPFMGNDGAYGTASPRLTHIAGPPITQPGTATINAADAEYLIWYLATSEPEDAMINGRPYSKNGWNPSLLVRIVDSNPDGADSGVTYPVASIGSNSRVETYTAYDFTFNNQIITSSSTGVSKKIHLSVLVGEEAPPLSSQVFRVGAHEFSGVANTAQNKLDKGNGPSGYWKLTGEAFDPHASPNTQIENSNLLSASELEYHQDRLFVGSLEPFDFATDKGGLKALPESQNLGLTIFSSVPGSHLNFATGATQDDGLSFQILSTIGGRVCWLHSQFNQLFVGTTEEEFVITDIPMTPQSINISKHSHYGSQEHSHAVLLGGDIVYIAENGKSIRSMSFNRNRQRYESDDLLQFAKHITKNDKIVKLEVIKTETPLLFAFTENKKLWCFTRKLNNNVYGWSEWTQPQITIQDILATVDNNNHACLYVRYTGMSGLGEDAIFITSDPNRTQYHIDCAEEIDVDPNGQVSSVTAPLLSPLKGETVSCVAVKTNGDAVYIGDFPCDSSTRVINFGFNVNDCDKVVIGLPYTMTLAPNIPEVMVPGKGSTLGRDKNISRLRILFNQALGAVAAGYNVFPVPLDTIDAVPTDRPGFYSVPVVGQYGPQPTINIDQSASYGFEVSGYNAEYDFGD